MKAAGASAAREEVSASVVTESAKSSTALSPPHPSAPARVAAIARNTFREAVRDRVLYNLVLFVLILTVGAVFLGELSATQEAKIIVDMGLSAALLFGVFIAIFVGVGLVYKEIERRTIYAIFAKPVGRGEFLLGKYLGLCLTLAVNVSVMGAGVSLALLYVRGGWGPLVLNVWPAVALVYVELMILVAVALLFSSFSSAAPTSPCCSRPRRSSSSVATSNDSGGRKRFRGDALVSRATRARARRTARMHSRRRTRLRLFRLAPARRATPAARPVRVIRGVVRQAGDGAAHESQFQRSGCRLVLAALAAIRRSKG